MSVFLDMRKSDQFRQGSVVKVARLPSSSCPVKLLELFLERGEHQPSQSLFCLCQKLGTGYKLRQAPLSYSRAREQFRQMISELGLDSNEFGLHSLRSGGASQAARSGVSGRVWRRHGGWRSIQAADGYVDESLENTLVVSRNLALYICPINSDGLTMLDDTVSLPQVDMLNNFWTVPLWYPSD